MWTATAAPGQPKPAQAVAATGEIRLDGVLDEADWRRAPVQHVANQKLPRAGEPATLETRWRVVVGASSLYVGIECLHTPKVPITARLTRRDRDVESDRITIDVDSRGKGRDAFHFEVTAGGTLVDGVRFNETDLDRQWDVFWDAAVKRHRDRWVAEVEIPLRALRRPAKATDPVRIQVRRYVSYLGETAEWVPTPRDNSREVSVYGPLRGFDPPGRRVSAELLPYMTSGVEVQQGTGVSPALTARAGADLKLRMGADATLDATAYPDFGNVEADEAVFNLNAVEVRFPEKRPFFLEGIDVLATPFEIFYTRRIGSLRGTTTGTAIEAPPPAPVLGAAKLVARTGRRWSLASLGAVSQSQDVRVADEDLSIVADRRVVPTYAYGLIRARRDLPHAGFVGLTGTTRAGFDPGPRAPWPTCPDGQAPVRGSCFADVYLLSGDTRLRSADGNWVGTGQVVGTFRHGGTPRHELDGNVVESGDVGPAVHARVEKTGGRLIGYAHYEYFGKDADWNATGFLPTPNRHFVRAHFALQDLQPHGPVLDDRWQMEIWKRYSLDGVLLGSGYQLNYRAKWRSFWRSFTELLWRPAYFDNREARDGTPVERAGLIGWEQFIRTDHRRKLVGTLDGEYFQRSNGPHVKGEVAADWNALAPLQLRLALSGTFSRGEPRWMETDADAGVYRLGELDARSLGLITRINYTITNKLELQLFAQLLGVNAEFERGYVAPIGAERIHLDTLIPDPTFERSRDSEALFVANLFLRWEYALGSNLYLVATRNQLDPTVASPGPGFDYLDAFRNDASYLFLVKTTVLLGW